ncbi:MAG: MFS transporter [Pseudomonadales bacterium]
MFFGWYIVGGTFIAQLFLIGFFSYSVSLFVAPVQAEFGVGLEEVMYSLSFGTLFGLVAMPAGGILIDRYSTRWVMSVGAILFAAGLYLLSIASSITQYVVLFGLTMAVGNALAGSQPSSTTISRWFTTSRGRALGISALGTSVGGIVVPLLLAYWIEQYGWRLALEYFSYAVALVVLPTVALSIRGTPAEAGLEVEDAQLQASATASTAIGALTTRDIISNSSYWLIGLPLSLLFCVYLSVLSNITPYVTGLGHSTEQAGQLITVIAIGGIVGKVSFGFAADKINLKIGLWLAIGLVIIGFLILATEPSYSLMLVAATLLGLATGGQLPVWGAMMARAFGLVSYGRAMGLMSPMISLIVMPGFIVAGKLVDMTGNYVLLLNVFCVVLVVAAIVLAPLKLDKDQ